MTVTTYAHHKDIPAAVWRRPNFSPAEIACRGTGRLVVNPAAMDALERLRVALGAPMILRSAYRSPEHNAAVGGANASKHMEATAFDVSMANHKPHEFEALVRARHVSGIGDVAAAASDAAGMAGDAPAAVEDLHGALGGAGVHRLADQGERHGVEEALDLDVV